MKLSFPFSAFVGVILLICQQQAVCQSHSPGSPDKTLNALPSGNTSWNYPAPKGGEVVLDVRDPYILELLEHPSEAGLSLPNVLQRLVKTVPGSGPMGVLPNAVLYRQVPAYTSLADVIRADLASFDRYLGIPAIKENPDAMKFPAGNVARQFDERWLQSNSGFFLLTGVINRFDKKEMSAPSNCGEVRFIYRLAYKKTVSATHTYASRLPFFLNVVFEYPNQANCFDVARSWQAEDHKTPADFIAWLHRSPLNSTRLQFKQIELNAQVVRFPAGMMQETGGQATYLMRVYRPAPGGGAFRFERAPLENTPDVRKLQATPRLKAELLDYIREHVSAIDVGVFQIPEKFLATEALSLSPLGNNRLANKPFNAIFRGDELNQFSSLNYEHLVFVKSPAGLMERLNNGTCMGCHQGNSTAGFHFFGLDRKESAGSTNQIRIGTSPHYFHDAARRAAYLKDHIAGNSPSLVNPLSYAPIVIKDAVIQYRDAAVNEFCLVHPDADFHPNHTWKCESEALECRSLVKNDALPLSIGNCVPRKGQEKLIFSGQACREGKLTNAEVSSPSAYELPFNFFSFKDAFASRQIFDLPENKVITATGYNCRPTRIGVPLGRAFRNCTAAEKKLTNVSSTGKIPDELCGLVGGAAFDRCAEGNFHDCLSQIVFRGALDTCHSNRFCREDYMCQKLDSRLSPRAPEIDKRMEDEQIGFCTPTYFLYQMRIDGHPAP